MYYLVGTNGDWSTIYACEEEWNPKENTWKAVTMDGEQEFKAYGSLKALRAVVKELGGHDEVYTAKH